MESTCEPASTEEVKASHYPGMLVIRATGTVPESCWRVEISKSPLTVWPPEFAIKRYRTAEICLEVVREYSVEAQFPTDAIPENVVIHDDQGRREIPVDVQPDASSVTSPPGGEFTGHSDSLSYDEALRDAVNQVPVNSKPDQGYFRFKVSEVAGEAGGIARLERLSVRIKTRE